jgi:hypothetical protein
MRNTDTNTECEGAALALPAAHQTADEVRGMTWWNGLDEADRRFWLRAALSAVPADAWTYYKRVCT